VPYAEVTVRTDVPFRHAFTYRVPDGLTVAPGDAVLVPFGRQTLPGVVLAVGEHSAYEGEVRDLLLAGERLLLPHQVELARWLAARYLAPIADCVALMLPPELERRLAEMVVWTGAPAPAGLSSADAHLLERLRLSGHAAPAALRRTFGGAADPAVDRLVAAGVARRLLALLPPRAGAGDDGETRPAERDGAEAATTRRVAGDLPAWSASPPLTAAQAAAVCAICAALDRGGPAAFLLHGVTGSGKTEVYLAAVAAARARGRRAIVLVPEIALTPQAVDRFRDRFPGAVAVSHSGLTAAERYRQWCAVRAGRAAVVVGARSALFLPQPDPGLIVIDEEHEPSFKQHDPAPRYHARDAALKLAALTGAVVVLGSATPDVVSYHRAARGRYTLLRLPDRVTGSALPTVSVVDLAAELRAGNRSIFSRALDEALAATLRAGEQAILYLNRRGSASFVLCRDCGHVPRCGGCLVPLTYHAGAERLRCHHCNRRRRVPERCPRCNGVRIRYLGLGTQRVEEEVRRRYPTARVLRWDRDTARTAAGHAALLAAFAGREADVLVGTQMIAKGLDLPGVTLVGIVSADVALNLPDFRAGERAFQLLTQVAGRAGRGDRPGRVIIQTYAPHHYAICAAALHDYEALYRAEIALRGRAGYPPFGRLARLVYAHTNAGQAEAEARRLARELLGERARRGVPGVQVIGPAPALHARLRGRWRWQIMLRAADPAELLEAVSLPRGWSVDVDPVSLL
jgi:primosomal protein N' (replication factor Y)